MLEAICKEEEGLARTSKLRVVKKSWERICCVATENMLSISYRVYDC